MIMKAWPKYLVAIALAAAVVGWEIASPWWTVARMRDAAQARDAERLAKHIDFPQVKSNLKGQLVDLAEAQLMAKPNGSLVRRVAFHTVIDPIVDAIVSQEALRVALLASPIVGAARTSKNAASECGIKRDGVQRFRLRCARLPNGTADLVFERNGWGWEMVGIDLPADYGEQTPIIK